MNRQRNILLLATFAVFLALAGWLAYQAYRTVTGTFVSGAPPVSIKNFVVPNTIPLGQMRPPAIRPTDQMRFGGPTSSLAVIEFGDYYCADCRSLDKTLFELLPTYKGKVRLVWRDMVKDSKKALAAAAFVYCAGQQGRFWEAHQALIEAGTPSEMGMSNLAGALQLDRQQLADCRSNQNILSVLQRDSDLAQSDGVTSTPIFFVGTKAMAGPAKTEQIKREIETILGKP